MSFDIYTRYLILLDLTSFDVIIVPNLFIVASSAANVTTILMKILCHYCD